ncbi:hypothetical protein IKA92_03495 [bacterium]|nr:hypothetical protein [bacterium]
MSISNIKLNLNKSILNAPANAKSAKIASNNGLQEAPNSNGATAISSYNKSYIGRCDIKNKKGEIRFWTIKSENSFKLYSKDNLLLYKMTKTPQSTVKETVYSIKGEKLWTLETYPDGTKIKEVFGEKGTLKKTVKFSSENQIESSKNHLKVEISEETKNKLPEYLYHITSTNSLENIKKTGLQTGEDNYLHANGDKAIFLLSKHELLDTWCNLTNGRKSSLEKSLIARLLKFCDKDKSGKLTILKIPTSSLNLENLKIRGQEEIGSFGGYSALSKKDEKQAKDYMLLKDVFKNFNEESGGVIDIRTLLNSIYLSDEQKHLEEGLGLEEIEKTKEKPFEYFYKEKIDPKNIEIVGNLDIKEIQPMSLFEAECEELSWFMVEKCLKKAQN